MQLIKELALAAILAALAIVIGNATLDRHLAHRHLEMQVTSLERAVEAQAAHIRNLERLAMAMQYRALTVETRFTASELLEVFAVELATQGVEVMVHDGQHTHRQ